MYITVLTVRILRVGGRVVALEDELRSSSEIEYQALIKAILDNKFPKGTFLSQRMLAEISGTSIISVREALRRLEFEHIVESIPKWGVRIPVEPRERIYDLYRVREGLEVMVAYLLCHNNDAQVRERLLSKAKACDAISTSDEDNIVIFAALHRELHIMMAENTGNRFIKFELERFTLRSLMYQSAKTTWVREVEDWHSWHQNLIEEIYSGDCQRAQEAMHRHIQHGLHNDLKLFEAGLFN